MVEATKQPFAYDVLPHRTIASMAGRQVLDAIVDGRLLQAPISQVLNFWLTEVGDGVAAFEGSPRRIISIPLVLSTAVGLSRSWTARGPAPRIRCFRVELDTQRSRPRGISQGPSRPRPGRVRADARVVAQGRQIISAEVYVFGLYSKVMAHS